ncbi:MAG: Hsp33 family molecular chaperone HslO [Pseudomonadota bacterium]
MTDSDRSASQSGASQPGVRASASAGSTDSDAPHPGAPVDGAPSPAFDGDDAVLPFQLDSLDLRGRVVRLDQTLDTILSQHRYPPSVSALVGEASLLTAMIGQAMKLRGRFSLQARGEGQVGLIATDYFAPKEEGGPAHIRAYAQFKPETPEMVEDPFTLLGGGLFAMTIDQGAHMHPYQGLVPLAGGSLSDCAASYFAQSEQIATRFYTGIGRAAAPGGPEKWRAGGIMVQHLAEFGEGATPPDAPSGEDGLLTAQDVADMGDRSDDWRNVNAKIDSVEMIELIGPHVSPETLLWRLFHEDAPRVYPSQAIRFGCTCSRDKVETLLRQFPAEDLEEMMTPEGDIVADCQFCGTAYAFSAATIAGERND